MSELIEVVAGGSITNVTDICRNFPVDPQPRLPRENLYDVINKAISSSRIVVLEGEPLSGKTECSAEIMRRLPNSSIGVFLNYDLGIFNSTSYVRLVVAEQAAWILDGVRLPDQSVPEEDYQHLLYRLQRFAKNTRITWVIDGLLDSMDNPEQKALLKLIPFGVQDFDFVITGESDVSDSLGLKNCNPKVVPVFPVGLDEAIRFFSDLDLNVSVVNELRSFSGGNVGQMQKLRSFVRSGLSVDELINDHKPTLESLFEFEWSLVSLDTDLHKILAYTVFSNKPTTLTDLSGYLQKSIAEIEDIVSGCRILSLNDQSAVVSIESRAQRSFVRARLSGFEASVRSHIITTLLSDPGTKDATLYLPAELLTAGKHDDLISHLGPKHFLNLLETERSLRSIRLHAGFGIRAANVRDNKTAELSLSLIKSAATGLMFSIGFDSQIEALIKMGAPDQALELASMAATSEERLHLLSIAASTIHQNGNPVHADLKDQIRILTTDLSSEDLGDLGIEIACNLLPVDFDMAANILSEVLQTARKKLDVINNESSQSVLSGALAGNRDGIDPKRSLELLSQNQAKRFSEAVAKIVDGFSVDKIWSFIKPIEPANKIMVLARWIGQNRRHPQVFEVAEQALDMVLSEVSRAPRLQDLREIAEVLPYIEDQQKRDYLTGKIETQIGLLGHQGTSEEYIRLQLLIYRVRFEKEPDEIELLLIDLFAEIDQLTESSVQVTCWTWMLFQLSQFRGFDKLEMDVSIIAEVTIKLSAAIDRFLSSTANHFAVARPAIAALAQTRMDEAEKLVARLNTEASRDKGYLELVKNIHFSAFNICDLEVASKCVLRIVDDRIRNDAICSLLKAIGNVVRKQNIPPVFSTVGMLWESVRVASIKLQAYVLTCVIRLVQEPSEVDLVSMEETQKYLWDEIIGEVAKVNIGYWIASEFAVDFPAFSREWLQRTVDFSEDVKPTSISVGSALASTISMAIRVLPYTDVKEADISRIRSLIDEIKEPDARVRLWTVLGIKLYCSGRESVAKMIVNDHIEPILNQTYKNNGWVLDSMVEISAPLLYLVHPATATLAVSKMGSAIQQESARVNICDVLMRRAPIGEPIDNRSTCDYLLSNAAVNDVLNVLKDMCSDSAISWVIQDLCSCISSDRNKSTITRNSAINALNSLQGIVDAKLPDNNNIKHDGYRVVSTAYIYEARSKVASNNVKKEEWANLYKQARNIPNVADRVIVTAIVGSCAVNSKASSEVTSWVDDIRVDLAAIPSDQDRVDRHDWVARTVGTADKGACRALVSDALKLIVQLPETDDVIQRQRSLMDLANSLDEKLADHLISLNDADEARQERLRIEKVRYLQRLALTKNPAAEEVGRLSDHELADSCWDTLGRLNAQRITPRSIYDFCYMQERASKMPIKMAAPIWHYVLESSLRKRKNDRGTEFSQQLFDATCKASEVVCGLIGRGPTGFAQTKALEAGIIRNGDREIFIDKITSWAKGQVGEVVKISDPYFGPEDMQVIKTIASNAEGAKFYVLTSREHIKKKKLGDVVDAFESAWVDISDDSIPEITIVVIGLGSEGKHPIHDRWILSGSSGLRLGTSVHSMGGLRTSEVSNLNCEEVKIRQIEIDGYLNNPPREIHGERLVLARYSI